MRSAPNRPNKPASTSEQFQAEKNEDERSCCACCISSNPGWAYAPNAIRPQQKVSSIFILLKAYRAGINNGFLFAELEQVVDDHAARTDHFRFILHRCCGGIQAGFGIGIGRYALVG